jgi:hypothetical protein
MVTAVFFHSCEKNEDTLRPVIRFELPAENLLIKAGDTVRVKAIVNDNEVVRSIKLSLVNSSSIPETTPLYIYPDSREAILDVMYPIDNMEIPSGDYYLLITASDGYNQKNGTRPVKIAEPDIEILNYIMVKRLNSSVTRVEVAGSSFNTDTVFNIQKPYGLSDISSKYGLLYFSSKSPSKLYALNTFNYLEEWGRDAIIPYPEFIHSEMGEYLFLSSGNGSITGYDSEGGNVFQTDARDGYYPQVFHVSGDYVVASQKSRNGSNPFLVIYYVSSGFERNQIQVTEDITAISSSGEQFILFMNSGLNGVVKSLDVDELIYTELSILENINIIDAIRLNDNSFLVATVEGIFEYELYLNRFTFFSDLVPDLLEYDVLFGQLFATRDKDLISLDLSSGQQQIVHQSADPILNFHILYNR